MPTVIDTLVVKLGLDNSGFNKGKSNVKRDLDDLKGGANNASKSFDSMSLSAGKFLALLGGAVAVKKFVSDITESNAALSRFATNTGLAVSQISALSGAARVAGGGANDLEASLSMLSKAQTELKLSGTSSLLPFFNYLGIAMTDVAGNAVPVTELITKMNRQMSGMDKQTAFNAGQMFGISPGMMNLIMKSPAEFDRLIARQQKLGPLTKEQAAASEKLRESWVDMQTSGEAMSRSFMAEITPALQSVLDAMQKASEWASENKEFVGNFFYAIAGVLTAVYLPAISRVAIATIAATWPFLAIAAAIASISAAIALAVDDFQSFKRGADSVFNWAPVQKVMSWLGIGSDESSSNQSNSSSPRGIRNNNPGNLNYAGQKGATKEGGSNGRFAVFGSMGEGLNAMVSQIGLYMGRGNNTIRGIINKWAPSSENNTSAYIDAVSKKLGISPDAPLSMENQAMIQKLVMAIVDHENGAGFVSESQVAAAVGTVSGARRGGGVSSGASSSNTQVSTNISEIKVYTQATDAKGIAGALSNEIENTLAYQMNGGMN